MSSYRRKGTAPRRATNRPNNAKLREEKTIVEAQFKAMTGEPLSDMHNIFKAVGHHPTHIQHKWALCQLQNEVYRLRGQLRQVSDDLMTGVVTTVYQPNKPAVDLPTVQEVPTDDEGTSSEGARADMGGEALE